MQLGDRDGRGTRGARHAEAAGRRADTSLRAWPCVAFPPPEKQKPRGRRTATFSYLAGTFNEATLCLCVCHRFILFLRPPQISPGEPGTVPGTLSWVTTPSERDRGQRKRGGALVPCARKATTVRIVVEKHF